jgi:hypothetical protein
VDTEKILMAQRELKRWRLTEMVEMGKITLSEAGKKIGSNDHLLRPSRGATSKPFSLEFRGRTR